MHEKTVFQLDLDWNFQSFGVGFRLLLNNTAPVFFLCPAANFWYYSSQTDNDTGNKCDINR